MKKERNPNRSKGGRSKTKNKFYYEKVFKTTDCSKKSSNRFLCSRLPGKGWGYWNSF